MFFCTLIFAPNSNSYGRFIEGSHAPTNINWGHENRTTAIRIPGGPPSARRIEHRVSGGDANPYLVIAVILGAALNGIEKKMKAPSPTVGNGYDSEGPTIIKDWESAIKCFSSSDKMKEIFDPMLIRGFIDCKNQEFNYFRTKSASEIIFSLIPYIENHLANGGKSWDICKHLINLVEGIPKAKVWRNQISNKSIKKELNIEYLFKLTAALEEMSF